jgi:hypothetical protein
MFKTSMTAAAVVISCLAFGPAAEAQTRWMQACPSPGAIRSVNSNTKANVSFSNNTGRTVSVVWLDYDGKRKPYRTLKNNEVYEQETFVGHPWLIVDSGGGCLGVYWPRSGEQIAELYADR